MSNQITLGLIIKMAKNLADQPGHAIPPSGDFEGVTFESYGNGLLEPRRDGSLTVWDLEELMEMLPSGTYLTRFEDKNVLPGCDAYRLVLPGGVVGYLGACDEEDVPPGLEVIERNGRHGPEKIVNRSPEEAMASGDLTEVSVVTFIVGPNDNGMMNAKGQRRTLWTWHPGDPKVPTECVKLHHGGNPVEVE